MKTKTKTIILLMIIILLILPYLVVEINTVIWGDLFQNEYQQTGMINDIKYFKVFYVKNKRAKVYYVDNDTATIVWFIKYKNSWKIDEYETVWSEKGSASQIIFPYYPH